MWVNAKLYSSVMILNLGFDSATQDGWKKIK